MHRTALARARHRRHGTARHGTAWSGTDTGLATRDCHSAPDGQDDCRPGRRHDTARHSTARHGCTARHGTARHATGTGTHHTAQHRSTPHSTALARARHSRHGTAGTALHGTAWHGKAWTAKDTARHGTAWLTTGTALQHAQHSTARPADSGCGMIQHGTSGAQLIGTALHYCTAHGTYMARHGGTARHAGHGMAARHGIARPISPWRRSSGRCPALVCGTAVLPPTGTYLAL